MGYGVLLGGLAGVEKLSALYEGLACFLYEGLACLFISV